MRAKRQNNKSQLELSFKLECNDFIESNKIDSGKIIHMDKYIKKKEVEMINKIISLSDHLVQK